MRTNNIRQVRLLYVVFFGILLVCLGLFVFNLIAATEETRLSNFAVGEEAREGYYINDLVAKDSLYRQPHPIEGIAPGLTAQAHIAGYTVDLRFDEARQAKTPHTPWILMFECFEVLAVAAIVVLAVVVLASFYRSAERGKMFPQRQVSLLTAIGVLVIAWSICADMRTYLVHRMAATLLGGTEWEPAVQFSLHFIRIFFGLTLVFVAQLIKIGRSMQEEQDLTI